MYPVCLIINPPTRTKADTVIYEAPLVALLQFAVGDLLWSAGDFHELPQCMPEFVIFGIVRVFGFVTGLFDLGFFRSWHCSWLVRREKVAQGS